MNFELMKNRRKELGMTQQDLADKCGLSKNTIYNYEKGRFEPTMENIEILSKELNLSITDLLEKPGKEEIQTNYNQVIESMRKQTIDNIIFSFNRDKNFTLFHKQMVETLIDFIGDNYGYKIYYSKKFEKVLFIDFIKDNTFGVEKSLFTILLKNILTLIDTFLNTMENEDFQIYGLSLSNIFKYEGEFLEKETKKHNEFLKKCINNVTEGITEYKTKKVVDENGKTIEVFYESINPQKLQEKIEEIEKNKEGGSDE